MVARSLLVGLWYMHGAVLSQACLPYPVLRQSFVARCAKEALYVQKLFAFMGVDLEIRIWSDSSAAVQAAQRLGTGKMRHLETQCLWIQELVKTKRVTIHKVKGELNPADIYTKDVPRDVLERHL